MECVWRNELAQKKKFRPYYKQKIMKNILKGR